MEASFFRKRFVVVAGKGGVGKSTMCAALGLAAARRGRRTVTAELNTRPKAAALFGVRPADYAVQEIAPNLHAINIRPDPALKEYALMKLKWERAYRLVFENEAMKRLLRMIPGMNELILLGKAFNMERERRRDGRPTWDTIIVDAPATGHGVSLLRLPQVILEVVTGGHMAQEVTLMRDLLLDERRTVINLVSLPEEMPVRETIELAREVEEVLRIPKGYLLVNQVWPDLFTDRELGILRTFRQDPTADPRAVAAARCVESMTKRRRLQDRYLKELRLRVDLPTIEVPFLFSDTFGAPEIRTISGHITKEAERVELHGRTRGAARRTR